MKFKYVLTATDENPLYMGFIPIFIKAWKTLFPEVTIRIILIANSVPQQLLIYREHLILFKPIEGVHTAYQAQVIRILYPSLFGKTQLEKEEDGVLITDMDMIPMNRTYYYDDFISNVNPNKFIAYRNVLEQYNELAICYNLATPMVWSELFNIFTEQNLRATLIEWYQTINYLGIPGKSGWTTDQTKLYQRIKEMEMSQKVVYLTDIDRGYNRMNRSNLVPELTSNEKLNIKNGYYSDYHMHRPYENYKQHIDEIVECLLI